MILDSDILCKARLVIMSRYHKNICREYRQPPLLPIFQVRCFLSGKDCRLLYCVVSWPGHCRDEDIHTETFCTQRKFSSRL